MKPPALVEDQDLPPGVHVPGIKPPQEKNIHRNASAVAITADWDNWPAGEVIEYLLEISFDDGATWGWRFGFTLAGGPQFVRRDGDMANKEYGCETSIAIPGAGTNTRKYRTTLSVLQACNTAARVRFY